ncbi:MAG: DNA-3-methyladenine glycosylase family protein [Eubacteriales bacterium]
MKIKQDFANTIIKEVEDFNIKQILECGQCFRFKQLEENEYMIIAHNKILRIKQVDDVITLFNTTMEEFNNIWIDYFDLNTDYKRIKKILLKQDDFLYSAISKKYGIRILRQDTWETLISFIISQNKQIPHIKKIVETISKAYGNYIGTYEGVEYYSFPTPEQLIKATEAGLRECKTGFRAPYIIDACEKIIKGDINLKELKKISTEDAKKRLLTIKGVGNKIADCVLLYGLARGEVFPTDVWIKRVVEHIYLKKEVKLEKIQEFASSRFGDIAGYAQQYLFYYGRENRIGK